MGIAESWTARTPLYQSPRLPPIFQISLSNPPKKLPDFEAIVDHAMLLDIRAGVGKNLSVLVATLPNICSVEKVQQDKLSHNGKSGYRAEPGCCRPPVPA
jgi:hypothetical protein